MIYFDASMVSYRRLDSHTCVCWYGVSPGGSGILLTEPHASGWWDGPDLTCELAPPPPPSNHGGLGVLGREGCSVLPCQSYPHKPPHRPHAVLATIPSMSYSCRWQGSGAGWTYVHQYKYQCNQTSRYLERRSVFKTSTSAVSICWAALWATSKLP